MTAVSVEIEGLRELRAALRRMAPALTAGVREAIKDASQIVAYEAQRRSAVSSGAQRASTRAFASGNRGGVRVMARRVSRSYPSGYPYPRRNEFEGAGRRAFVAPALEAKKDEVVRRLGFVLDDVAEIWDAGL